MTTTLFNPTNEDFFAQYGGSNFTIPKYPEEGHMMRVDDNKANHVLNQFGPRGLTFLDFGDDSDDGAIKKKKAKEGRRRNLEFKRKQIATYNRDNEARKARHLEYIDPPEQIQEYAKEIGVKLEAPYEVADVKNEEIAQLRKDKEEGDKRFNDLQKQMAEFLTLAKKGIIPKTADEKEAEAIETVKAEIKPMNRQTFEPWVKKLGQEGYGAYPIEVQVEILNKWAGFFDKKEKAFPY